VLFDGWRDLGAHLAETLPQRLLSLSVNHLAGGGEQLTTTWRWEANRPYVSVRLAAPRAFGLPGVVSVKGLWDRQSYQVPVAFEETRNLLIEERQRVAVSMQDWVAARVRWEAEVGFQRWQHRADEVTGELNLEYRPFSARWSLQGGAEGGLPIKGSDRYLGGYLGAFWQSKNELSGTMVVALSGVAATSEETPLVGWLGAGSGRNGQLRAHKLRDNGIVEGNVFGRTLAHGSVELQRWFGAISIFPIGVAGFVDAAQAWHRLDPSSDGRLQVDTGAGLRIGLPGGTSYLRFDAAYGLRDSKRALSVGWERIVQ
jgi:hypothetical protein